LIKDNKFSLPSPSPLSNNHKNDKHPKKTENNFDFILSHFNQERLFPRKIMTKKLNRQQEVFSKEEAMKYFIDSDFIDCRINAFPSYTEYKGIQRYPPDLIFIDLDRKDFTSHLGFENALYNTLKNIKQKLRDTVYPTVLKTGGGYHIILPIDCTIVLENIKEFQEFEKDKPSQEFLRFTKDLLSDGKADKQHYPSFKSCLLRIPGSINSKNGNKITIIQKWDGYRPKLSLDLLLDFKRYLRHKNNSIRNIVIPNRSKKRINYSNDYTYYEWIERILQTPFEDYRKIISSLILAPYLINVKRLPFQECFQIIKEWLDKCNSLEKLDDSRSFNLRISYSLKKAKNKQIGPMSQHKIKTDSRYSKLHYLLKKKGIFKEKR
jgi:Primase X